MASKTQIETMERYWRTVRNYLSHCIDNSSGREKQYWEAAQMFALEFEQNVSNAKQLAQLEEGYGK